MEYSVILNNTYRKCVARFSTSIFHDLNPSRPLINSLKYFLFGSDIAEIFNYKVKKFGLRGVIHIAKSKV